MCEYKPSLKIHNHFTHRNHTFCNCNEVFSFMRMHELWSIRLGEILFLGGLMRQQFQQLRSSMKALLDLLQRRHES